MSIFRRRRFIAAPSAFRIAPVVFRAGAGESGDSVAQPRAWRGSAGAWPVPLRFLTVLRRRALTASAVALISGSSTAALLRRPAGFDASEFYLRSTAPGRVCRVCCRLPCLALLCRVDVSGWFSGLPRCLTITSEERETWTAGSLRPASAGTAQRCAARELLRRSRFQIHRALAVLRDGWSGCVWDSSRGLAFELCFGVEPEL